MEQIIIGLFENGDRATQAIQELSSIGVGADNIQALARPQEIELDTELGGETFPTAAGAGDSLPETLVGAGVPVGHAHAYAEAVRNGQVLLLARPDGVPSANVKAVMLSNGASNIMDDQEQRVAAP